MFLFYCNNLNTAIIRQYARPVNTSRYIIQDYKWALFALRIY